MKKLGVLLMLVALLTMQSSCALGFGASSEITVVSREDGSGTRGAFIELFGVEQKNEAGEKIDYTSEEAIITNSTSVMMTTVSGNPSAIGYISLGSMNDTVKALKIDGIEASAANVANGTYTIARPFNIATKADVSEATQDFINFILSDEGQQVVASHGYVALPGSAPYEAMGISGSIVIAGSSSVTPIMEKLKEAYAAVNANVSIEIQQSDSTTGMTAAIEGICDIGMASRELKDSEIEKGISGTVIAMDGIAVIVSKDCPALDLTADQVKRIFTGETTVWSDIVE